MRHGQTGYLVEPGASEALAERAWRILSDPPLARSMGGLAECSSSDYSWDHSADALVELYAATLGQAASGAFGSSTNGRARPVRGPSEAAAAALPEAPPMSFRCPADVCRCLE